MLISEEEEMLDSEEMLALEEMQDSELDWAFK